MTRAAAVATNADLFARAKELFPGGVNSPVRAYRAVGGTPRFVATARGARVRDVEGREYVDYVSSWGAILAGHADPDVTAAVAAAAAAGTGYGAPALGEIELAERIRSRMPSLERMRFTSSGTEAVMSAIRLARGATGRTRIVKFAGGYHGHSDALLAEAGSGIATLGLPGSAGVPEAATRDTLVLPYNDPGAVRAAFARFPGEIAAVLVEPVAANMGLVLPRPGFLEELREITAADGALLVFDEVITGFRVAPGGAQERFGILPDLTCLGKVVGGGLPVGVFGGRAGIMRHVAPEGDVYQAGTLSGNPVAMAAGSAALDRLADPGTYARLERLTGRLADGIRAAIRAGPAAGRASVETMASLLTLFWTPSPPADYDEARAGDGAAFARFFHAMLEHGILLPPSPYEAWFLTLAHGEEEIDLTLEAIPPALARAASSAA
ncbi:MAG TPA: glutamate-1-semialdehyde 2,1-aminomutase [Gemmatimonadota bacterium]|nr:glutamate-1-semialdehyde 2,1-aminomutase [Gemmatimonadota bacterium]